jgi:hypothetical protein
MRLPKIRGHFWVERDGEIIDADFYTHLRKKHKCVPELNVYLRAPRKAEEDMIRLFRKITLKTFNETNWDEMMPEFIMVAKMTGNGDAPVFDKCWTNCIQEVYHNGGEIRFGSMAFKEKYDGRYIWYYGSDRFQTLSDYLR